AAIATTAAVTAAATPATAAAITAATAAVLTRARLVDGDVAPGQILPIHRGDRRRGLVVFYVHKTEPLRAPRLRSRNRRLRGAPLGKCCLEVLLGNAEREIADEQSLCQWTPFLRAHSAPTVTDRRHDHPPLTAARVYTSRFRRV